ncbi:unnamed protein product [Paramecium sonneborni]|uniref:Kinesin-like protein n=1 Tax=Paramecium sonneborni TaxID=65129 RepID=A0A8S1LYW9_9CILI|nr:unnamed protein product [Paramecium sonneborni]
MNKKTKTPQQQSQAQNQQINQPSPMMQPMSLQSGPSPSQPDTSVLDESGGESVKVALRIRPMNQLEQGRGDEQCIKAISDSNCQLYYKGVAKQFRFNAVLDERCTQQEVFMKCNIQELLDAALDGYSATIFAYGQTGSGKTYTISGVEERLAREKYISDDSEGIIPRATRYLWQIMAQRAEQFYVKASFTEIYNEQLRDLLNPASGILHCRWNLQNGFFVEDLMIVECTSYSDIQAVLHEGMRNRKQGSHELNKDSSRSHSILTAYLIGEQNIDGQIVKRYGKFSFVDLAGSERLKESKSQGDMIKETGNINKSLFTLGKVIKSLSDKKNKLPYIPYRDSKLTMLLMDSLGGTAKALMIACVSPSAAYYEETLSTINYATSTMNIQNKPVISMGEKDQIIYNLTRERDLLKMENQYLREQLQRYTNGLPIEIPNFNDKNGQKKQLPPLPSRPISHNQILNSQQNGFDQYVNPNNSKIDLPVNKILHEYQMEINKLKQENDELRNARDVSVKNYHIVMNENNALQLKLENLEQIFIGNPITKGDHDKSKIQEEYMSSALLIENSDLKKKVASLEEKNMELAQIARKNLSGKSSDPNDLHEIVQLKQTNNQLQQRVEFLQARERDLLEQIMRLQRQPKAYAGF